MATEPVLDSIETGSPGPDTRALLFQRLERVRARRRTRRKRRIILVVMLVVTLVAVAGIGFPSVRSTWLERLEAGRAHPVAGIRSQADVAPAAATEPPLSPAIAVGAASQPQGLNSDATQPNRIRVPVDTLPSRQAHRLTTPARGEPKDAEGVDPAAVIDWLLKTSRRGTR